VADLLYALGWALWTSVVVVVFAEEAVAMYRELAEADPGKYRPDLAASLRVLADSLDLLGRGGDGAAARSEAAALTGGLAE
jgi:hypothetical protein